MRRFWQTYKVELGKIRLRRMAWVFAVLIILVGIATNGINYYFQKVFLPRLEAQFEENSFPDDFEIEVTPSQQNSITNQEMLEQLTLRVKQTEEALAKGEPGVSDRQFRNETNDLAVFRYQLEHGILQPEAIHGTDTEEMRSWDNLANGGNSVGGLVLTFAVVFMSLAMAGEYEKGTLKSLVIRPVSRGQIFFAKFASVLTFAWALQILNFLVNLIAGTVFFGFGDPTAPFVFAQLGHAFQLPVWLYSAVYYKVELLSMILPLAITLLLAVSTRANSATIALALVMSYLLNPILTQLASILPILRFTPFLHMNLATYLSGEIPVDHTNLLFSAALALAYTIIALLLGRLVFKRRDI